MKQEKQPIEDRLRTSVSFKLYDGTDFDRQVCGWQMQEAADEITSLRARIAELERFWIPVTESLPPLDVPVWLIDTDKNIWIGARSDSEDGWLWGHCYDGWYYSRGRWRTSRVETNADYRPTHWAHLPEPPVAEENISSSKPSA